MVPAFAMASMPGWSRCSQVVGGETVELGEEGGAALVAELFGVEFEGEAEGGCGFEQSAGLGCGEADGVAECVDGVGEGGGLGEHLGDDMVDVGVGRGAGGGGVGGEEAGLDGDGAVSGEGAGGAEHAELGFGFEAVTGFDLDGGDAFGEEGVEAGEGGGDETGLIEGAGGADGAEDAAAFAGDLFVGDALEAAFEFLGAVATVNEVGVAVDETGGGPGTVGVVGDVGLGCGGGGTDPGDAAVIDEDCGVFDGAVWRTAGPHGRGVQVGPEFSHR